MKIVVFDLDETLGYFTEYGIFWDSLCIYVKNKNKLITQEIFDDVLDLFPEFLRPNIINILLYLKTQKELKLCSKMMIYTNNNGPREWAKYIINYFEKKINYKLIDQIIGAFKINGKKVEICRTTNNKTHSDFIKCTKLPINSEICFLDDTFYPEMANDNIYYINVKAYYYDLSIEDMINRFKESDIGKKMLNNEDLLDFSELMNKNMKMYNYKIIEKNVKENEIDKILSKEILLHLHKFFKCKKNKTIKRRMKYNTTRKFK